MPKTNIALQNRFFESLCIYFNKGATVWNLFEMSGGAIAIICNHASFLAQNSANQIHYPFYSLYRTPHNFLFKNWINCRRIRILYWGFSWSVVSSESNYKRGTLEVFWSRVSNSSHCDLQRWLLWCGLYSYRHVKFGRLETNQLLFLSDAFIRLRQRK